MDGLYGRSEDAAKRCWPSVNGGGQLKVLFWGGKTTFCEKHQQKSQKIVTEFEAFLLMIKELWRFFGIQSV
jgi:hypothetical protein